LGAWRAAAYVVVGTNSHARQRLHILGVVAVFISGRGDFGDGAFFQFVGRIFKRYFRPENRGVNDFIREKFKRRI